MVVLKGVVDLEARLMVPQTLGREMWSKLRELLYCKAWQRARPQSSVTPKAQSSAFTYKFPGQGTDSHFRLGRPGIIYVVWTADSLYRYTFSAEIRPLPFLALQSTLWCLSCSRITRNCFGIDVELDAASTARPLTKTSYVSSPALSLRITNQCRRDLERNGGIYSRLRTSSEIGRP